MVTAGVPATVEAGPAGRGELTAVVNGRSDGCVILSTLHDDKLDMRSASTLESKLMNGDPIPVLMDCILLLAAADAVAIEEEVPERTPRDMSVAPATPPFTVLSMLAVLHRSESSSTPSSIDVVMTRPPARDDRTHRTPVGNISWRQPVSAAVSMSE